MLGPTREASSDVKLENQQKARVLVRGLALRNDIDPETLKDSQTRVDTIKLMNAGSLLEIFTAVNSTLRGDFKRWRRDYNAVAERAVLISEIKGQVSPDLEAPAYPEANLESFFTQMREEITPQNINHWAIKLYTAIIFLHMFGDGNGRLARNAYEFVRRGELSDDKNIARRPVFIGILCDSLNRTAVGQVLINELGDSFKDWHKFNGGLSGCDLYQVEDNLDLGVNSENGLTARLKWVAAKRAGIIASRAKELGVPENLVSQVYANGEVAYFRSKDDEVGVILDSDQDKEHNKWTRDELRRFKEEYTHVRDEWFEEVQNLVDEDEAKVFYLLEVSMNLTNPLGLHVNEYAIVLKALAQGDIKAANEVIIEDRGAMFDVEKEGAFIADTSRVLKEEPELQALALHSPFAQN